jgi:ribokinase
VKQADTVFDVVCIASWNADLVSTLERPPARGETLMASDFAISPGGKGSNAAVAAARQGARAALIARIGDDDFGRMGLALWRVEGIGAEFVECAAGEASGVAQIWVYADGDNSIAVCPGAGAGLGAEQVQQARHLLEHCRVVMASCEVPLAATLAAFTLARASGALTVLNPAPARPLPDALLELVDVLTPNETELHALADCGPAVSTDAAAARLLQRGVGAVLVTLGASGCCLYRQGMTPMPLPGHHVSVIDTIGAGDCFTGTLAAALARGEPLVDAMRAANTAAALSVTRAGAVAGMPTRAAVQAALAGRAAGEVAGDLNF